jgi:TetR/AcrR family transcriptional regulator, transcriptional repressor of bet genes
MGRPSLRERRRAEIVGAFAHVLAEHGYEGATIMAVATRAGMAPGLVHHYFAGKAELLSSLLDELISRFRMRVRAKEPSVDPLTAYLDGAVGLDQTADLVAARCWVGLFAEAVRDPGLFTEVRRLVDTEIGTIQRRSGDRLSPQDAGAVLAFVIGALVLGAFAPRKTAGFASPALRCFVRALLTKSGNASTGAHPPRPGGESGSSLEK